MLQSIDEAEKGEMATSVIENKGAISVKTVLVDRDHRYYCCLCGKIIFPLRVKKVIKIYFSTLS